MILGYLLNVHAAHTADDQRGNGNALQRDGQIEFLLRLHHLLCQKTVHRMVFDLHVQDLAGILTVLFLIMADFHAAGLAAAACHDLCLQHKGVVHGGGSGVGYQQMAFRNGNGEPAHHLLAFKFKQVHICTALSVIRENKGCCPWHRRCLP